SKDEDKGFLKTISEKISEEEKFKRLVEQIGKDRVMIEKLETLGNQLLINRIIGGAAFTTLTGALAGTLAIGGVAGTLVVGGAALAGFLAIVAIAAIVYTVYRHRGEIKEGVLDAGKAIKSLFKDLIDKLPTVQARENNFAKLNSDLLEQYHKSTEEERTKPNNKIEIITMLQDKDQRSAIMKLIEDKTISFSKEGENGMDRLVEKGTSTHEADKEALKELMDKFQPAIMAIGNNNIEEVKEKVNKKVQEMKPQSQVGDPSSEQVVDSEEQITPS
ncbi:glycine zipper family protein, partial [Wolbachia endosymbiont of Atemnus politus]|uniref:glycine zipper family protein n=1 Tax=Wolbachia endosymbiont of Atemnus politus TaxID=2682840 RepID=UPI00157386D1